MDFVNRELEQYCWLNFRDPNCTDNLNRGTSSVNLKNSHGVERLSLTQAGFETVKVLTVTSSKQKIFSIIADLRCIGRDVVYSIGK